VGRIVLANPPFNRLDLRFLEYLRQAVHDASESDGRVVLIVEGRKRDDRSIIVA
jgi:enoyl-CoA hydratase/carnithine racemase